MRLEYDSSLEEMSSLSVTSGEQVLPGPKRKSRDVLSKYQPRPPHADAEKFEPELLARPDLARKDTSFKKEKQENSKLVDLLWKGKWQDVLERLTEHPEEAKQEIQLPDFSMESAGASSIFINALPLHLASAMRPLPPTHMLQALIQAYPEACKKSTGSPLGLLPLHLAADLTDVRYTGDVQKQRESPSLESRDDVGTGPRLRKRPSKVSESPNQAEIVKLLLEICPESALLPEMANEMLPLHIAASTAKPSKSTRSISPVSEQVLELIVEAGPPQVATKIRDKGGKTPMDYAWNNMQYSACQMNGSTIKSSCNCIRNFTRHTHPLLQSVIKFHLTMMTPAIRETEFGFIKPTMMQTKSTSRAHSTSTTHLSRSNVGLSRSRAVSRDDARSVRSPRSRSSTPTTVMVHHAAQVLRGAESSRTESRLTLSSTPKQSVQLERRDEDNSAASPAKPFKPTQKAAKVDIHHHSVPPREQKREIWPTTSCAEQQQASEAIVPCVLSLPPDPQQDNIPNNLSNFSDKMYTKAILSSNIRGRFRPIKVTRDCFSPVEHNAKKESTTLTECHIEAPERSCVFDPFGGRDLSRAFEPDQNSPKALAQSDKINNLFTPRAYDGVHTSSLSDKMTPLNQGDGTNGTLCLQLHLTDLVHPSSTSTSNRSFSPGGVLRRSNSFGNIRKKLLPNPCFEVFLAHRAGLSKGYYKSYPLFNTAEGTWEEAFIDTGLTRRQLENGVGGGSHVEVGVRVLHCPEKGSDMAPVLIGTCVISLDNLERNAALSERTHEYNMYPVLHGYEVKGWLQVLSFQIK